MAKYLLKRIVTKSSIWEVETDNVSVAIKSAETGSGKQIGWEQSEIVVRVISESNFTERELSEKKTDLGI